MEEDFMVVMLVSGTLLLMLGLVLGGVDSLHTALAEVFAFGVGLLAVGIWVRKALRSLTNEARIQRTDQSEFAEKWTPYLFGNHPPYVIEAAEKLGQARETTAVPHLIYALEQCVETQPPCWCEMGEALVKALARIGDRRALPMLYRMENVRGIGFISAIRGAISAIEPPTSLLRPGSMDTLDNATLLHPVQPMPEENPQLLLRSAEAETI